MAENVKTSPEFNLKQRNRVGGRYQEIAEQNRRYARKLENYKEVLQNYAKDVRELDGNILEDLKGLKAELKELSRESSILKEIDEEMENIAVLGEQKIRNSLEARLQREAST